MARIRVLAENPPPPRGYAEDQLRELRDYITRMKDELEFLLTHLGADNMDRSLTDRIRAITSTAENAVPSTRTINGKPLDEDIVLDAADVGARPDDWMPTAADVGARPDDWMPTAADVGAPKYKQYNLAAAQTITHTFSDTCQFVILTERVVVLSAPQTNGLYFGFNSQTNASTNKIHTVYAPDADPPSFSQGLGTIDITTPVSVVRVTVIEFVAN